MPHVAGVEFDKLVFAKGIDDGKTGCENAETYLFHHLLTHTVSRMNFGIMFTSSDGSALLLCFRGKIKGIISLKAEAI